MYKIPFSFLPTDTLKRVSHLTLGIAEILIPTFPFLKFHLEQSEADVSPEEYLSMCIMSTLLFFVFFAAMLTAIMITIGKGFYIGSIISFIFSIFVFFQQIAYPKLRANKRVGSLERNLLPALQNIHIQLNSGVPLFDILVNISMSDYGELSKEFRKAIKDMNAGVPQVSALESMSKRSPSLFFRRTIWQISNGMRSGAELSRVIKETIRTLSEEQLMQIQKYGSQLNPMSMIYMLLAVILPSLGITFIIIMSSFVSLSEAAARWIFYGLFTLVLFFQIMFLGLIKSRRPNLID